MAILTILAAEDGISMGVVPSSFLRVGEDLVGGLDFGEFPCRIFDVAKVSIGVELEGLSTICFFDPLLVLVY